MALEETGVVEEVVEEVDGVDGVDSAIGVDLVIGVAEVVAVAAAVPRADEAAPVQVVPSSSKAKR